MSPPSCRPTWCYTARFGNVGIFWLSVMEDPYFSVITALVRYPSSVDGGSYQQIKTVAIADNTWCFVLRVVRCCR